MKTNFIIPIVLFLFINSYAQEKSIKDEYRNQGFFNITKFSYINVGSAKLETFSPVDGVIATSLNTDKAHAYSLQTINGYFFSPYFSAGIGVGLDGYSNPNFNTLPIFLDLRTYFSDEASSAYVYLDYGTMPKIDGGKNNGSIFNIGLGYKFPIKDRLMIVSDLGYSYKSISNDGLSIRKSESWVQTKGLILSFGIIF